MCVALSCDPKLFQIQLKNIQIVAGIAYLRNENVVVIGGSVARLQTEHRLRLYEELNRRMDEDDRATYIPSNS